MSIYDRFHPANQYAPNTNLYNAAGVTEVLPITTALPWPWAAAGYSSLQVGSHSGGGAGLRAEPLGKADF